MRRFASLTGPKRNRLYGLFIFKVEDIKYGKQAGLEEAQKDIQMMLFQDKFKVMVSEWLSSLKKKAYISIK